MTKKEALTILENMPEEEFQVFYMKLPHRTTLLLQAGMVDWKEVLPGWFLKFGGEKETP